MCEGGQEMAYYFHFPSPEGSSVTYKVTNLVPVTVAQYQHHQVVVLAGSTLRNVHISSVLQFVITNLITLMAPNTWPGYQTTQLQTQI